MMKVKKNVRTRIASAFLPRTSSGLLRNIADVPNVKDIVTNFASKNITGVKSVILPGKKH